MTRYLLIGGTTKAATTALFFYLRDHPDVCASSLKESRYFLDESYPLPVHRRYADAGLAGYEALFRDDSGCVRMEATPDYLYSRGTPERVHAVLPHARWVFILRDPVDRMVSWYRFAMQHGLIDRKTSFRHFIDMQQDAAGGYAKQHLHVMEQGRYSDYLPRYVEYFSQDQVLVLYFEEFRCNPQAEMERLCAFAGIPSEFFRHYDFSPVNVTHVSANPKMNRALNTMKRHVRFAIHRFPRVHAAVRVAWSGVGSFFENPGSPSGGEEVFRPDADVLARLRRYYAGESGQLHRLTGRQPPWPC